MRDIKLYYKPGACSAIPHALLLHVGLPHTAVLMMSDPSAWRFYIPADGSMTREQYRAAVHPDGYVPALVVDGVVITEMPAVMSCIVSLADQGKFGSLLGNPADPVERARVLEYLSWLSGTLHTLGFVAHWRSYRAAGDDKAGQEAVAGRGLDVVKECFSRVEERYKGREWAVGEGVTVVDFHLYLFRDWGDDGIGLPMAKDYPEYDRVMRKVESLEGMKKMLEIEKQKPIYG